MLARTKSRGALKALDQLLGHAIWTLCQRCRTHRAATSAAHLQVVDATTGRLQQTLLHIASMEAIHLRLASLACGTDRLHRQRQHHEDERHERRVCRQTVGIGVPPAQEGADARTVEIDHYGVAEGLDVCSIRIELWAYVVGLRQMQRLQVARQDKAVRRRHACGRHAREENGADARSARCSHANVEVEVLALAEGVGALDESVTC
jgi:hypothetical protein